MRNRVYLRWIAPIFALGLVTGCAVNPVTGESQLSLIPESQEWAMGAEQYVPTQQTQGGQFYLDPELSVYVREVGQKLAAVSDRPDMPYEFVVLNNSVPNAWALPSGKIAINRGLLVELEDEAQLASVLGHEIVHAAARHSVQRMQTGMILNAGMAGVGMAVADSEWAQMVMGGAAMGAQLALAQYGQGDELESDHYGIRYMVEAGYDPMAAVELQQLFVEMSEGQQSNYLASLFSTHPPSQARVNRNLELARELGTGGYRGREVFQKRLAFLKSRQPAYDAYDEAVKQVQADNLEGALASVNKAIKLESGEAMFYALRGQLKEAMDKPAAAAEDFDKAVSLYPEMFRYRLQRGLNAYARNDLARARTDLTEANRVVPTAIGYLRLGDIAARENRRDDAIAFYSTAAEAGGPVGEEARKKLAKLSQN
ncbi:MAG: M48 family metalloprotease [Marinobacter sp.]|uniref:M48 family metalloprotease n=1 Tax=Marinobacter sp. TaxID=50741 RepID=UPI00299E19D5|nr:M48 family metalloprotease [Marinobacter sp.]MDX1755681.1 M48 family metalloprotease [Marinobacter sp.]